MKSELFACWNEGGYTAQGPLIEIGVLIKKHKGSRLLKIELIGTRTLNRTLIGTLELGVTWPQLNQL